MHRPVGKAVPEGLGVLLGEQGGGAQHRNLLAVHDRGEGRAQRHLGLAEAHVAADQPVHGRAAAHVAQHGLDRGRLVGRLLEAEALCEGLVVVLLELEGMALARRAQGIEVEQFGGRVAHVLGSLALGFLPLARAQLVQRRLVGAHPRVAADQLQLADRHVEHGVVGVFQVQELLQLGRTVGAGAAADVHVDQAAVAANAVLGVHHRVAHIEFGQVLDQGLDVADLLLLLAPARSGSGGEKFGLG